MTLFRPRISALCIILAAVACKPNESGNIPCQSDANCPTDYSQCIRVGAQAGKCTEPVTGTPQLAPANIVVNPGAITGGDHSAISLALPALTGNANLGRSLKLQASSAGGTANDVAKSDGTALTFDDLGKNISVSAPDTGATDSTTYTFTLTVANKPDGTGPSATATGALAVVPTPVLASGSLSITPPTITGGTSPTLSVALPALTSAAASAASVTLVVSGCTTAAAVTKADGSPIAVGDLGTTINIASPSSGTTDNKTCTYTLSVKNAATTPAAVAASGALRVAPKPVLSSESFAVAPGAITGGLTPTLSVTLPSLTVPPAAGASVTFQISGTGCGSGDVKKTGNVAVALSDLGNPITFAPPTSTADTVATCTYTLTVSNSATNASAVGTLLIVPVPVLTGAIAVTPPGVTGGFNSTLDVALPSLNITDPTLVSSVTFAISGDAKCGSGLVGKNPSGTVGFADLGPAHHFAITPPSSLSTDTVTCTYTLDVFNAATTPVKAEATGSFNIYEQPVLASHAITISPTIFTGGAPNAPATLSIRLPAKSSTAAPASVVLTVDGSGALSKNPSGTIGVTDLGGAPFNVTTPATSNTDDKVMTYTLTLKNAATPPAQDTATGTVTVAPLPVLHSSSFTVSPAAITGGTSPALSATLPNLDSSASSASGGVTFQVSGDAACGTGDVHKTGNVAVSVSDLNGTTPIGFPSPSGTNSATAASCTYTVRVTNAASTTATATGPLSIVALPMFATGLTVTPNLFLDATTPTLTFALPALSQGVASSIALTLNSTPISDSQLIPANLGKNITLTAPSTNAGDPSATFTYSLTAKNAANDNSAPTNATVTSYPSGGNLAASQRVASAAVLMPNSGPYANKVLTIGGGTAINSGVCTGAVATAEVYDPATGTSTATSNNMTVSRCQHTATLVGTKVYVIGGANDSHIDVFDTSASSNPWQQTSLPTLQQVRFGHASILVTSGTNANKIVVAGGYDPSTANNPGLTSLELFDPAGGTSTTYSNTGTGTSAFNVGRGEPAAALAGKWIYFIGGFEPVTPNISPSIDALDTTQPVTGGSTGGVDGHGGQIVHSNQPTHAIGRYASSAIALNSTSVLVVGGQTSTTAVTNNMQVYTVSNSTGLVSSVTFPVPTIATGRSRFPLLAAGPANKYIIFGGSTTFGTPDTATKSIEVIDTSSTPSASSFGNMATARQAFPAVNLALSGASNFTFILPGGVAATAAGVEAVIGP